VPLWHDAFLASSPSSAERFFGQLHVVAPEKKAGDSTGPGDFFVSRDVRRREIRVFGGDAAARERGRKEVLAHLERARRQRRELPLDLLTYKAVVRRGENLISALRKASGATALSLNISNRSLLVEGDASAAEKVLAALAAHNNNTTNKSDDDNNILKKTPPISEIIIPGSSSSSSCCCPVCFCVAGEDDGGDVVRLSSCSHEYCRPCFESWIVATPSHGGGSHSKKFPIRCLAEGCAAPLRLKEDLRAALRPEDFAALLRASLDDHVNSNLGTAFRFCLTAGCGGVHALGLERVAACSACATSICTTCNVEKHAGLSCEAHLAAKAPPDRLRHRIVEEILTLRCPRCAQAFVDFEGCFALACSKCPCKFCGWCLADAGTSSDDAHRHVRNCKTKPPGADAYFGTFAQFEAAQRKRRQTLLTAFVSKLPPEAQTAARNAQSLKADLTDLGITL
jgi:hypothetical protein